MDRGEKMKTCQVNNIFEITNKQFLELKEKELQKENQLVVFLPFDAKVENALILGKKILQAFGAPKDTYEKITNLNWWHDEMRSLWWLDSPYPLNSDTQWQGSKYISYVLFMEHFKKYEQIIGKEEYFNMIEMFRDIIEEWIRGIAYHTAPAFADDQGNFHQIQNQLLRDFTIYLIK